MSLFLFIEPESMQIIKPLVLASKSPRRISLFNQIGLHPQVIPSHVPEDCDPKLSPAENAKLLALKKAKEVGEKCEDGIIVAADTIVVLDARLLNEATCGLVESRRPDGKGIFLGKPVDEADAKRMLRMLSGQTHTVTTGFALLDCASGVSVTDSESTLVTFRELPDSEIEEYVAGGSPMDKAGAYGIQDDYGAVFVTRIEGCFYNVVGFPLSKFYTTLQQFQNRLMERKGLSYVEEN